jgi:hypothetical protein
MKIGIFAKTFSRPTIEELFQTIAGYEIYSSSGTTSTTSTRFRTPLLSRDSSRVPGLWPLPQRP